MRLVVRYQLSHEKIASNMRKVLPLLERVGGGASVHISGPTLSLSGSAPPSSASLGPPSSTRPVPQNDAAFMPQSSNSILRILHLPYL